MCLYVCVFVCVYVCVCHFVPLGSVSALTIISILASCTIQVGMQRKVTQTWRKREKANGGEDEILLEQYEPQGCPINRQDCACYMTVRVRSYRRNTQRVTQLKYTSHLVMPTFEKTYEDTGDNFISHRSTDSTDRYWELVFTSCESTVGVNMPMCWVHRYCGMPHTPV